MSLRWTKEDERGFQVMRVFYVLIIASILFNFGWQIIHANDKPNQVNTKFHLKNTK